MKKSLSVILFVLMLVLCMVVFGICSNAADEPTVTKVENYTVTIGGITDVKEIRWAIGEYTTVSEIKAAEGNLTLSATLAANYIVDGVFTYDVVYAGTYTFCIRHNDGTNDFVYADVNEINTYLISDGLRLTVKDMKGASTIKDMWIAEGTWTTYSEIKNNAANKYQATSVKLANYFATNDFTYVTANPGAHTVLIRYNDGTVEALHIELTVDVPTFTQNGLQLTIGNIPGVKTIRSAYGEYNSIAEIKKAPLLRCFNNKTAIKDAEEYTIQYREAGVVTVIVEYVTGYKHVEHVNIEQKEATVENTAAGLKFGNLDGLVMIRYAKGEYTSVSAIKNAEGSVVIKPDSIVDGFITIAGLSVGDTYTFCVQYDDESYNYYVLTITEAEEEPEIVNPTFVVSDVTAFAGDTVDVTVAVKNNPGLASIGMHVSYADELTLNSVTYNTAIGGNPYIPQDMASPVKLVWVSPFADVEDDWTFATLNFTVASDAAAGDYAVTVSYNEDDVYDLTESNVYFEVDNGVVTVK